MDDFVLGWDGITSELMESVKAMDSLCKETDALARDLNALADVNEADVPKPSEATTPSDIADKPKPLHLAKRIEVHSDSSRPVPYGCHRVVKTYDDLVPIAWADVPDGMDDPEPMYLSTEAARIMMMSDQEFDEYEKAKLKQLLTKPHGNRLGMCLLLMAAAAFLAWILFLPVDIVIRVILFCVVGGLTAAALLVARKRNSEGRLVAGQTANRLGQAAGNASEICDMLEPLQSATGIGHFAETGIRQVAESELKRADLTRTISEVFSEGSISWQRFSATVDSTCETIRTNTLTIGREMELLRDLDARDVRSQDPITAESRSERRQMHDKGVTSISETLQDNERLLLEMDKLKKELLSLRQRSLSADNKDALDEIRQLVHDTSQYV